MLPVSVIGSYEIVIYIFLISEFDFFLNSNVFHFHLSELLLYTNSTITAASGFSMYYIDMICKTAPPEAKNLSGNDSVVHFDVLSTSTQHLSWLVSGERDRSVCQMTCRWSRTLATHRDCPAENGILDK